MRAGLFMLRETDVCHSDDEMTNFLRNDSHRNRCAGHKMLNLGQVSLYLWPDVFAKLSLKFFSWFA